VRTAKGLAYAGDQIVLAVPASVWSKIKIEPPLPAILTPQMGTNVKFLSKMSRRSWEPGAATALMSGAITSTWDGTEHQRGAGYCLVGFSGGDAARETQRLYNEGGRSALINVLGQAYPKVRPPDLIDFSMTPNRRLSAVRCQETEFRWC
jgi:monoamine oxidase